jgi:hypothetical protein
MQNPKPIITWTQKFQLVGRYPFNLTTQFHAAAWNNNNNNIIIIILLLYRRLWSEEEKLEIPLQKKIVYHLLLLI